MRDKMQEKESLVDQEEIRPEKYALVNGQSGA